MKKVFAVVLAVICLLCGCQKVGNLKDGGTERLKTPVPDMFSAQLTITQYKKTFAARLDYAKNSNVILTYNAPESVNGLTISKTQSGVQYTYLGLPYSNTENVLPQGNVIHIMETVFSALEAPEGYTVRVQGDTVVYAIEADGVPFTLTRSKETMAITAVEAGGYNCLITFEDFTASV